MPKTVWHTKKRILAEDELRTRKDAVVEHMQQITTIEAEKKVAVAEFTRRLKPHQTLVKDLMAQITTGVDEGRAECEVQVDTVTQTVRFIKVDRKWNDELQEYEHTSELFDTKTFDEVGEKQLSMWQDNEVDDSVDSLDDVLTMNESNWLSFDFTDERADSGTYEDTMDGLLTPMSSKAANLFLSHTGSPDTVFIQTLKNVGLRNALEMIKKCLDSIRDDPFTTSKSDKEENEWNFMKGVFTDPDIGYALLDHIEEIPYRRADDEDGINFHGDEIPEEVAEGEDGDE